MRAFVTALSLMLPVVGWSQQSINSDVKNGSTPDSPLFVTRGTAEFEVRWVTDPKDPAGEKQIKQTIFTWKRPGNVDWVILIGCGGGGSGATAGPAFGLGGGSGVPPETVMVGPLKHDEYKISIGLGGARPPWQRNRSTPGTKGGDTTFAAARSDNSIAITFYGGHGGSLPTPTSGSGFQTRYLPATRSSVRRASNETAGGGAGEHGEASLYADGGATTAPGQYSGGGGGAGKGPGGIGGASGKSGGDAEGLCAGGGGAGSSGPIVSGGAGGDGYLAIIPLVSANAVSEEVNAILERLKQFGAVTEYDDATDDLVQSDAEQ